MGNADTKLNFRKAVIQLTTKTQPVEPSDEAFWNQFWSDSVKCVQDVFTLIPAAEIRALREESPSNLATLCYKAVEKLVEAAENGCGTTREQQTVLNCVRLLTRILPYIFEDPDWRGFFWSTLPGQSLDDVAENESSPPLAQSLLNALSDLLFCPDFTVATTKKTGPDNPEDIQTIDSCEYIWEAGVGFAHTPATNAQYEFNRTEILKLLLTCFSETMYLPPVADAHIVPNQWIAYFTSTENRHALPLFTSMLNVVCAYDPVGYGVPYNHLMFADAREPLVEAAIQVLCVSLDNEGSTNSAPVPDNASNATLESATTDGVGPDNLFVNYMSRIHREEDFFFILKGLTRLLNNPLIQTYLPGSCKKTHFHQEMLVMFWRMCDINKKFMFYVLKSSDVLDILVPILFHLNDARADQSRVGLMHIGVFILLLLSGERNFGVRLNKPYTVRVPMDIPVFTGTHADFLIIVFHKIITTGHQRLQPLFDCLLTIIVNISPYLKTLSMVASSKLLHLLEAFSTPWFLYSSPTNHHLVFFLLEVFNNIIQYQFDGNSNLVYTIIRKRNVFHQLANLPIDHSAISKALSKRGKKVSKQGSGENNEVTMEGAIPAVDAEPGTLKATLMATPVLPSTVVTVEEESPHAVGEDFTDAFCHDHETKVPHYTPDDPWDILRRAFSCEDIDKILQHTNTMIDARLLRIPAARVRTIKKICKSQSVPDLKEKDLMEFDELGYPTQNQTLYIFRAPTEEKKATLFERSQQKVDPTNDSEFKTKLALLLDFGDVVEDYIGIDKMTEKSPASAAHNEMQTLKTGEKGATPDDETEAAGAEAAAVAAVEQESRASNVPDGESEDQADDAPPPSKPSPTKSGASTPSTPSSPAPFTTTEGVAPLPIKPLPKRQASQTSQSGWVATPEWVASWKQKLPLQTIMRLLQVLVPQVEKICIDKGLTDESEILKFLQHGTLVGLLPVPHPILIRKYQANSGTTMWFRTYMWGVIYLRNVDPPVWYDTDVKLFEIQRV